MGPRRKRGAQSEKRPNSLGLSGGNAVNPAVTNCRSLYARWGVSGLRASREAYGLVGQNRAEPALEAPEGRRDCLGAWGCTGFDTVLHRVADVPRCRDTRFPLDVPTGVPTKPPPVGMGIGEGGRGSIKTTSRSRASRTQQGDPSKVTWLTPYWDAWTDAYGGEPNGGILAKALEPLHDKHGEAVVLPRWRYFLNETPAGFVNPHRFASTFGSWEPQQEPMSQYSIDSSQVEM